MTNEQFRLILMSKTDEIKSHVRDFIIRSGDDEVCNYAVNLFKKFESDSLDEILMSRLAIAGLMSVWSDMLNREAESV